MLQEIPSREELQFLLRAAYRASGLSLTQLDKAYTRAGGDLAQITLKGYVSGKRMPEPLEWNRLAAVINAALNEKGMPSALPEWSFSGGVGLTAFDSGGSYTPGWTTWGVVSIPA